MSRHYTPDYSRDLGQESRRTAAAVVPLVIELVQPKSVIDVGCGTGSWLAEFRLAGVSDVLGLDGNWIRRDQLQIPDSQFEAVDLARPFLMARTFDVACCIEVAEHLPADTAESFIATIVSLAPIVLFSAAVPFQGGTHHVNEQWADYWQALFARHDFIAIDFFRSRLWDNPDVQPYLAQNLWLYVAAAALTKTERLTSEHGAVARFPIRAIHPGVFQVPSARRLLRLLRARS